MLSGTDRFPARMRRTQAVATIALAALALSPASAEEDQGDPALTLEEIVVTAQKRAEAVRDVPASISALSGDSLVERGAFDLQDFASYIPGLNFVAGGGTGQNQLILRGISAGDQPSATVGVYVGEVPYGSSSSFASGGRLALDLALFDVERVEVLRGPQGTLYGASAMGGLLKYVMRQPDPGEVSALVESDLSYTEMGGWNKGARGVVNLPLVAGRAALRVSAYWDDNSGIVDNVTTGAENTDFSEVLGGRTAVLMTPSDTVSIEVTGLYQEIDRGGYGATDVLVDLRRPAFGDFKQARQLEESFQQEFSLAGLTVDWDLDWASLVATSSWQNVVTTVQTDDSQLFGPLIGFPMLFVGDVDTEKLTHEVRLVSSRMGSFEWILGGFYTNEESVNNQRGIAFPGEDGPPPPGVNPIADFSLPTEFREYAAFGDVTWFITDRIDILLGARWSRNDQDYNQISSGLIVNGNDPSGPTVVTNESGESVWTFLASPRLRFGDDDMVYARVASGYRPGGPNVVPPVDPVTGERFGRATFDADSLWNYEVGAKLGALDGRLQVDAALFWIDWTDIQVNENQSGFSFRGNGGAARSRGLEAAIQWLATDGLTLGLNLAYTDAELTEDSPGIGGRAGDPLTDVPEWSFSATADYVFPVGVDWTGSAGAAFRHVGERSSSFPGNEDVLPYPLGAYSVVDLRAGIERNGFRVNAYVKNLLDERGELSVDTSVFLPVFGGSGYLGYNRPRTWGVSLSADF